MRFPATVIAAAVFIALFTAAATVHAEEAKKAVEKLNTEQFDKKRAEKDVVLLDVRTPEEFKAAHVPGAKNIDIKDKSFEDEIKKLDKDKTYVIYCRSGRRSAAAGEKMAELGFGKLFDYTGGMIEWGEAGKPVEKGDGAAK